MDPMEAIKQTYFQECEELLLAMEEGLISMESGEADSETINAVFRAVHSIKGGGGAFGFERLVTFSHAFETVLDLIRSGQLHTDPEAVKLLLRAGDMLADFVAAARSGSSAEIDDHEVLAALSRLAGEDGEEETGVDNFEDLGFVPMQISIDEPEIGVAAPPEPSWQIHFRPHPALYAKGNEPYLLLRELCSLGHAQVTADLSAVPLLNELDPEGAYLAWDIVLTGAIERPQIEDVFDFVIGSCDLEISERIEAPDTIDAFVAQDEPPPILPVEADPLTESAAVIAAAAAPDTHPAEKREAANSETAVKPTIRVDLDKVDRLVNLVGELVITQAMVAVSVNDAGMARSTPLGNGLVELEQLLRELQEGVMAIRTQPVKSVFQRMPRLVRELAAQTGKEVRLVLAGEGTEVDKTVIERLGEPLTHMLRNAIDHGLETPEERVAAGKPREGVVTLTAEHRGGRIVIEVTDDGRGINRERVRAKAIEKGLIAPNAALSDEDIDNLIFLPGFSTASQVSNISGRGVGMDVVRRNIVDLGGRIVISSLPGKGSRFVLTLPLTLAVLDGMVVAVGDQTFVLPLSHVIESFRPKPEDVQLFGTGRRLLRVRNTYVPLVAICDLLHVDGGERDPTKGVVILVECDGAGTLALAIDTILGQRQVVIKSFEGNYQHVDGIAAATILGDGRVALILDVDGLVSLCREDISSSRQSQIQKIGAAA